MLVFPDNGCRSPAKVRIKVLFPVPLRPMTASIAAEMAEAAVGSTHYHALFATGLVLFVTTFIFNAMAFYFTKKFQIGGKH